MPQIFITIFIKFRTANHYLPMETGRWYGIPKLERTCHVCNRDQIVDKYHSILECNVFELQRIKNLFVDRTFINFPNYWQLLTILFLPNYAFLNLKYMKKSVLHNLCHNSHVPCILYIFVHFVYSGTWTIKWFEWNKLNWIELILISGSRQIDRHGSPDQTICACQLTRRDPAFRIKLLLW